jgi:CheY-specific phosphatase CheX
MKMLSKILIDSTIVSLQSTGLKNHEFNQKSIKVEKSNDYDLDVTIAIHGDINGQIVFSWFKEDAIYYSNVKMREVLNIQEEHLEFDDLIFEIMAEFANEIAGVFLTKLSKNDINIRFMPPIIYKSGTIIYPKSKYTESTKVETDNYSMQVSIFYETIEEKVLASPG